MPYSLPRLHLATLILVLFLTACSLTSGPGISDQLTPFVTPPPVATATATPTPVPPRLLTVCMVREPESLFLYGDTSASARSIREAIYDGPTDTRNYETIPVILEKRPSLGDGDAAYNPVEVKPGDQIVDASGTLISLAEGVRYQPSGCNDQACVQVYTGAEPVMIDQVVVRFKLRAGITWSDGTPLKAEDSVFSFDIAKSLYPRGRPDLISRTLAYTALDETTLEWRGVPGFHDPRYATNFFSPLPSQAWSQIDPETLLTFEASSQKPLGWGPYVITEWIQGDHISLQKNPTYFRASEGLPHFDNLVFRFMSDGEEALAALLAGECDYVDESAALEGKGPGLLELQEAGRVSVAFEVGTAWEHADFGISPYTTVLSGTAQTSVVAPVSTSLFQLKEVRQAVAYCIDRQRMADELFYGKSQVPDTFVPQSHPYANPEVKRYSFDPAAGSALLQSIGWIDSDNNPSTPRLSQSVAGLPDGTPFSFTYLTGTTDEYQKAAEILKDSLAQCGIQVNINPLAWDQLFAPGPDGLVFGRKFQMAQYAWVTAQEPPCFLYTTSEIPGPYPRFSRGWGGGNISGYSNPAFDTACQQAAATLPDMPAHLAAHHQAQAIFAEELPSIPLYQRLKLAVMRPDMCNVQIDPSAESALSNLEAFDYGETCNSQ